MPKLSLLECGRCQKRQDGPEYAYSSDTTFIGWHEIQVFRLGEEYESEIGIAKPPIAQGRLFSGEYLCGSCWKELKQWWQ